MKETVPIREPGDPTRVQRQPSRGHSDQDGQDRAQNHLDEGAEMQENHLFGEFQPLGRSIDEVPMKRQDQQKVKGQKEPIVQRRLFQAFSAQGMRIVGHLPASGTLPAGRIMRLVEAGSTTVQAGTGGDLLHQNWPLDIFVAVNR
jgi:hypothetical protein